MAHLSIKLIFVAGTKNRRNSRYSPEKTVFLEFLELYCIFFHEIWHTDAKCQCLKCDRARFLKNVFFRKCRKYAGKTGLLAISQDFIISFFQFFAQRCVLAMLITLPSPIFEKKFFPAEYAGNRRFCRFCPDFSLIFRCFSFKNITNNNAHHKAWFICHF